MTYFHTFGWNKPISKTEQTLLDKHETLKAKLSKDSTPAEVGEFYEVVRSLAYHSGLRLFGSPITVNVPWDQVVAGE